LGAGAHAAQIWEETIGGSGRGGGGGGRGGGRRGEGGGGGEEEEEEGDEASKAYRNCFVVNAYTLMPRADTWSTASYGGIGL
jgi:hypothetical protein